MLGQESFIVYKNAFVGHRFSPHTPTKSLDNGVGHCKHCIAQAFSFKSSIPIPKIRPSHLPFTVKLHSQVPHRHRHRHHVLFFTIEEVSGAYGDTCRKYFDGRMMIGWILVTDVVDVCNCVF
ncbi:hypothetical protein V6N13_008936 [Hibiscus sabdariffa]|uniref:Uncharacterized protein n=1 Tax=Hibiscus sabdariffa TaxID=183260 RepID=A0ABR2NQZ1_9ROSI